MMQDDKLIITHQDGSQSIVENPFSAMQATYDALAENQNAMPELLDESRAEILMRIERDKKLAWSEESEKQTKKEREEKEKFQRYNGMNRHERRKQAAIARKAGKNEHTK